MIKSSCKFRNDKATLVGRRFAMNHGFTLIELITVVVILGIVSAVGSRFLITSLNSYRDIQERTKLIAKGRVAIEQMTRQLRLAVPNAVRVSSSGNCIEFLPVLTGATYLDDVPDNENAAPTVTSISTVAFSFEFGTANHAVIAPMAASEVYATGSSISRVSITPISGGSSYSSISFSSHRFIRNSPQKRVFVAANPIRFCLSGGSLFRYSGYGFSALSLSDANPGGSTDLMSQGVTTGGTAFSLSAGSEDRNTAVNINLSFTQGNNTVSLQQQVLVRNVP